MDPPTSDAPLQVLTQNPPACRRSNASTALLRVRVYALTTRTSLARFLVRGRRDTGKTGHHQKTSPEPDLRTLNHPKEGMVCQQQQFLPLQRSTSFQITCKEQERFKEENKYSSYSRKARQFAQKNAKATRYNYSQHVQKTSIGISRIRKAHATCRTRH